MDGQILRINPEKQNTITEEKRKAQLAQALHVPIVTAEHVAIRPDDFDHLLNLLVKCELTMLAYGGLQSELTQIARVAPPNHPTVQAIAAQARQLMTEMWATLQTNLERFPLQA